MTEKSTEQARTDTHNSRWRLAGDVLKFQAKLFVDGLRDLLMSPISLVAALMGLVLAPANPRRWFDEVLRFGRQTEVWINLFGRRSGQSGFDDLIGGLEQRLQQQVDQGGITAGAKQRIDQALDRLQQEISSRVTRPADEPDIDPEAEQPGS